MLLVSHGVARCAFLQGLTACWQGWVLGTASAPRPSTSQTDVAFIYHDPAHQADMQQQSVEKDMHSCWQLSCCRRSTRALGNASASTAEATGRGEADTGPQGSHSHP